MLSDIATLTPPLRLQGGWNGFVANDTIGQGIVNGDAITVEPHRILPYQQHHALMKMQQGDSATAVECQIFLAINNGIHEDGLENK